MKIDRRLTTALVVIFLVLIAGCGRGQYTPIDKQSLRGSGRLYFIPLGDFPLSGVDDLAAVYKEKYGLFIETLPNLSLNPSVVDTDRQQIIAEAVVALMKGAYPDLANNREAILIGLTTRDMYIQQYNWQFTFSWRQEGKYAVVSNARMDLDLPLGSEEKERIRLRKMVTKNIGIMYFRLPQSTDPRSVLYKNVGGLSELDYMGEEF